MGSTKSPRAPQLRFRRLLGRSQFRIPFTVGVEFISVSAKTGNISAPDGNDHFIDVSASLPLTYFRVGTTDAGLSVWWKAEGR